MSFALGGVKTNVVLDDRLNFDGEADSYIDVPRGPSQNTYVVVPSQNYNSAGGTFQFTIVPSSLQTAVSRRMLLKVYFQITMVAVAGASGFVCDPGVFDGPRFAPIANCTSTIACLIGNSTVNLNTFNVVNAFSRTGVSDKEREQNWSTFPSMTDSYQSYQDSTVVRTPTAGAFSALYGAGNDPLVSSGENSYYRPRGAWAINIVRNDEVGSENSGTAIIQFESTEPLWVSPMESISDNSAFIGLSQITIQLVFNNLARAWSHSDSVNASTVTSVIGTLYAPPEIHYNQLSIPANIEVPPKLQYGYNVANVFSTNDPTPRAPGESFSLTTQNVQLSYIPSKIYVFVRASDSYINSSPSNLVTTTDTFANINSVSIFWSNQNGILSGSSEQQLWLLSKESGLNLSFQQWHSEVGSILVLDVGKILALSDIFEAPSQLANKNLQITLGLKNINNYNTIPFTAYVVTISEGVFLIDRDSGTTYSQSTVLSKEDVLNAELPGGEKHSLERSAGFYGGATKASKFFHKVGKFISKAAPKAIEGAVSFVQKAVPHAERTVDYLRGFAPVPVGDGGGVVSGGGRIAKSALKRRLGR
jgi:hypothetical protein